jgi:NAD(P)-dependent dehydrogenase (short-subunit alcohol dehydrogenase family)
MHAAIVTGVSRGLGEALAVDMLGRGFTVLGVGRAASPRLASKRFHLAACDLSQPALLAAAITPPLRLIAEGKPTAVTLVNNAAVVTPVGLVGHLDASAIASAFAINVAAPVVMADLFLRSFPDDSVERRIINISSGAAQSALPGMTVYAMSKAALEMMTRAIVAECSAPGFRCISLRPGIFDTGMQAYSRTRDPAEFPSVALFRGFKENGLLKDPAEVAKKIVEKLVLAPVEHGRCYTHTDL